MILFIALETIGVTPSQQHLVVSADGQELWCDIFNEFLALRGEHRVRKERIV